MWTRDVAPADRLGLLRNNQSSAEEGQGAAAGGKQLWLRSCICLPEGGQDLGLAETETQIYSLLESPGKAPLISAEPGPSSPLLNHFITRFTSIQI